MYSNWEKSKKFVWWESMNLQEAVVEGEKSNSTKAQKLFELCKSKACNWYCTSDELKRLRWIPVKVIHVGWKFIFLIRSFSSLLLWNKISAGFSFVHTTTRASLCFLYEDVSSQKTQFVKTNVPWTLILPGLLTVSNFTHFLISLNC